MKKTKNELLGAAADCIVFTKKINQSGSSSFCESFLNFSRKVFNFLSGIIVLDHGQADHGYQGL